MFYSSKKSYHIVSDTHYEVYKIAQFYKTVFYSIFQFFTDKYRI